MPLDGAYERPPIKTTRPAQVVVHPCVVSTSWVWESDFNEYILFLLRLLMLRLQLKLLQKLLVAVAMVDAVPVDVAVAPVVAVAVAAAHHVE